MPLTPITGPTGAEPPLRRRGDACPGALRLHPADDGALARVRLPAGVLSADQAEALASAAERLGDGHLDITSRGNVQLRGLDSACGGELADVLRTAALLPSDRHERARNIVASPLAGLDGAGHADVQTWARRLDELLCSEPDIEQLSGRFLFALDDGRGDAAALGGDVTLIAAGDGAVVLHITAVSEDGPNAVPGTVALRLSADDAPRAAVLAALEFLATLKECGSRAWRVRELPTTHPLSAGGLARRLADVGITATPVEPLAIARADRHPASTEPVGPAPGLVTGPDGRCAVSVTARLGRLTVAQWRLLAGIAAQDGSGQLRVTPWRGVVVPGLPAEIADARLATIAEAGLVTDRNSPWHGVGACIGHPGCAKSLADVRADIARAARGTARPLSVYWSGCDRRCGHPVGDRWVDVVATGEGYQVNTVNASGARTTTRTVPAEQVADAVAALCGTT